jgi:hypothetical protein
VVSRRAPTTFFAIGGGRLVGEIKDNSAVFGVCTNTLVTRLDDGGLGLNDLLRGRPSHPKAISSHHNRRLDLLQQKTLGNRAGSHARLAAFRSTLHTFNLGCRIDRCW